MTFLHFLRLLARRGGIEVTRFAPAESQTARLARLLAHHRIDTVLDVGANDGGYGKLLREFGYIGDILSFEPLAEPHQKLSALASRDPHWQIAPRMALGATDSEVEINVANNSTSSSILPMASLHLAAAPLSNYVGVEKTPIRRLDSIAHPLIGISRNTLLKIDTQGYEMQVLDGAEATLTSVKGIQIELSLAPLYHGQTLYREIIEWLAKKEFHLWDVIPGFTNSRSGQMLQMDGVFFRNDLAIPN